MAAAAEPNKPAAASEAGPRSRAERALHFRTPQTVRAPVVESGPPCSGCPQMVPCRGVPVRPERPDVIRGLLRLGCSTAIPSAGHKALGPGAEAPGPSRAGRFQFRLDEVTGPSAHVLSSSVDFATHEVVDVRAASRRSVVINLKASAGIAFVRHCHSELPLAGEGVVHLHRIAAVAQTVHEAHGGSNLDILSVTQRAVVAWQPSGSAVFPVAPLPPSVRVHLRWNRQCSGEVVRHVVATVDPVAPSTLPRSP